jgi:hypothetical protein
MRKKEQAMQKQQSLLTIATPPFGVRWTWNLWLRWVVANLVGEFVGLGLAGAIGGATMLVIGNRAGAVTILLVAGALVVAATLEGMAVGLAQWSVLEPYLPTLTRRTWVLATILGAVVAWLVGMMLGSLGSELLDASERTALLFGAALGPVVGALLGVAQWLALRQAVPRAGWWMPTNALAWTAGMAVIFAAMSFVHESTPVVVLAITWAVSGILAGVVVAAIHGLVLIWLLRSNGAA